MNRFRRLSLALAVAGVLGVAAPAAASAATTTVTISGATASYPLVSLLAQKYVKLFPKKSSSRSPRVERRSASTTSPPAASRSAISRVAPLPPAPGGPGLLPDREVRDLRGHEQSEHAEQPHARAGLLDLHRQDASWSQVPGATASGTIDLISRTSVAGVLTSFQTLLLEGKKVSSLASELPPRVCCARRSKTTRTGSASSPTTADARLGQLGQLQRRRLQPVDRGIRAVRRHRAILRGDQRQGDRRRVGVHRLDRVIGRGTQDHLQPVGPDHAIDRQDQPKPPQYRSSSQSDDAGATPQPMVRQPRRAHARRGFVACGCVRDCMVVFVFIRAWPIFEHNGLSWLGPGGKLRHSSRTCRPRA